MNTKKSKGSLRIFSKKQSLKNIKEALKEDSRTYVHNFQIITNMPWLTEEGVKHSLLSDSIGYKYAVKEIEVL